jgi:hypothetical protein
VLLRVQRSLELFGTRLLFAALLLGCASGPRYGASHGKKKKKGCDCPHWNHVKPSDGEVHACVRYDARH